MLASRTFVSCLQQLASEFWHMWVRKNLRWDHLHAKQFEEDQLVSETGLTFAEISSETWWRFRAVDGGIPFTQKSSFRYEILAPRLRLRRDVLFSYEDLIVSFGGVAALFLGYNFWGTSEMFYFFIDKAVKFVYERFVKR